MADEPPKPPTIQAALRTDGRIDVERIGLPREVWSDLFHTALTLSWARLLVAITSGFVCINILFAILYMAVPGAVQNVTPGSFTDAFAFSVQTFATIGYGGFMPVTMLAHWLVAAESLVGILFNALATGLFFAKFARPTAKVIFAEVAPICLDEGVPTLHLRMANGRHNQIVEAGFRLRLSKMVVSPEGQRMRRLYDLPLTRDANPIFALSWTVYHRITPDSPLFHETPETLERDRVMLIGILTGIDDTMAASVHARSIWGFEQIRYDHRYVDIMSGDITTGRPTIDYTKFHTTVEEPPERRVVLGAR